VIFNPNLHPEENMQGKIDRPEEYDDIGTKCVTEFRKKNSGNCLCILSVQDEVRDNRDTERELKNYYDIVWDERETHKFKNISHHLQRMKAFKEA
ncbi:MAG: YqiA/YcfP family alpha/beta fold hydrolase, partial [Plesiomonas sp.]